MSKKDTSNPHGFGEAGAALWKQYDSQFDLDPSDVTLLRSACEVADIVASLDAITRERGPLDDEGKTANWVQECRFQRGILLKLLAQVERLSEPVATGSRKNLGGTRAPYAVRSA